MKANRFQEGLKLEIRKGIVPLNLNVYCEVVERALLIERELNVEAMVRNKNKRPQGQSFGYQQGNPSKRQKQSIQRGWNKSRPIIGNRWNQGHFQSNHNVPTQFDRNNIRTTQNNQPQQQQQKDDQARNLYPRLCYNCNKPGHIAKFCMESKGAPSNNRVRDDNQVNRINQNHQGKMYAIA